MNMRRYHCLFLQGQMQIGKSTLLLDSLRPFLSVTGGFMVQRLRQKSQPRGFCLQAVADIPLEAEICAEQKANNVFIEIGDQGACFHPEVFEQVGSELLLASEGKKLIYLDEIGGIELLSDLFRQNLYRVLAGPVPCIGVIKSLSNSNVMQKGMQIDPIYKDLQQQLFTDIKERFNGCILNLANDNRAQIQQAVDQFLQIHMI